MDLNLIQLCEVNLIVILSVSSAAVTNTLLLESRGSLVVGSWASEVAYKPSPPEQNSVLEARSLRGRCG